MSAKMPRRVVADFLLAMVALALAYALRFHVYPRYIPGGEPPDVGHYVWAAPVVGLTVVLVFWLTGVYRLRRGIQFIDEVFKVTGGLAVALLVVLAMEGVYRQIPFVLDTTFTYSRLTAVYWTGAAVLVISLGRYLLRRYEAAQRAVGNGADRALVVGWGASADLLVQRLRMFPDYGYKVVGVLADRLEPAEEVAGARVLGAIAEMPNVLHTTPVDTVFFTSSEMSPDHMLHLIDCCRRRGVDVQILPGMLELMTTQVTGDQIGGIPLLQLRHGLDIQGWKTAVKRAFDMLVAGLGLIVISPLLALIALLVKISSPGPVLIHQERIGMRGRPFQTHKFRSMRVDAEVRTGPVWAAARDPRRTALGGVLRRLSLDELPQLWNIVLGDMSLVGPRPERPNFVAEFSKRMPRYCDRHLVRPGLAGWAQANDLRGQTPVEERLIYDLYYIENWSLAFDIKILLITLARVWTHKNAY
jgi:exopolysaccharide biosynthesis polyprenyl glycosylphosphotransferase